MDTLKITVPEKFGVWESMNFRENLHQLIRSGRRHFILNFNKCNFIDVTALGVLVSINNKCKTLNGSLKLELLDTQVLKLFKLTRLEKTLDIHN